MTARLGIAAVRKHGPTVTRYAVVSQPGSAPLHPFTRLCSSRSGALCPACGDALTGSLASRVAAGRRGA